MKSTDEAEEAQLTTSGEVAEISCCAPMDAKKEGRVGKDNSSENASSPHIPLNRLLVDARWKTEPKQYSTHIRSPSWLHSYSLFHFSFPQSIQTHKGVRVGSQQPQDTALPQCFSHLPLTPHCSY